MAKVPFSELSSKKCRTPGCERFIKQNIIDRKPSADLCYRCFCKAEAKVGRTTISGSVARKRDRGGDINRPTTEDIRSRRWNTSRKIL